MQLVELFLIYMTESERSFFNLFAFKQFTGTTFFWALFMVGPSNFRCVLWVHLQLGQLLLVPVAADVSQVSGNLCSGWNADLWKKISCCQALVIDIGVVVSWRITWIHYQEISCSTAPQTAEPELGHASVPQGVGLLLTSPHALV